MGFLMVFMAFFLYFFGAAFAMRLLEFGITVGDRLVTASGLALKYLLKQIAIGLKTLLHLVRNKIRTEETMTIRPLTATPVELKHLHDRKLIHSNKRMPVEIEYIQPKRK